MISSMSFGNTSYFRFLECGAAERCDSRHTYGVIFELCAPQKMHNFAPVGVPRAGYHLKISSGYNLAVLCSRSRALTMASIANSLRSPANLLLELMLEPH